MLTIKMQLLLSAAEQLSSQYIPVMYTPTYMNTKWILSRRKVGKMSQSKPEAEQTPLFSLKWYFIQKKITLDLAITLMSTG